MPETTRHIGLCPVCMRRIKVRGGLLVHHGYTRPGYGEIEGDCFGVHRAPYELSDSTAVEYLDEVILPMRTRTQRDLDKLPSATRLPKRVWHKPEPGSPGQYLPKLVTREEAGGDYQWRELYKSSERDLRRTLGFLDDEHTRLMELVNEWKPAELETVQEEQAAKRAAKAERERVVQDRREAKIADMVVKYQKRIDSAVRNQNMRTLGEIHESARSKIREASKYELTEGDALALLDRAHVWQAFGLYDADEGYLIDEWTSEAPASRYKQQVGPMAHILSSMGAYQFGLARRVEEREWPPELGEAKPKRRRRNW